MGQAENRAEQGPTTLPADSLAVPVMLTVFGASPVAAVAVVRRRSLGSRLGWAGLGLAIAWLLAFPAIFFPVLPLRARAGSRYRRCGPGREVAARGPHADAGRGSLPTVRGVRGCDPRRRLSTAPLRAMHPLQEHLDDDRGRHPRERGTVRFGPIVELTHRGIRCPKLACRALRILG